MSRFLRQRGAIGPNTLLGRAAGSGDAQPMSLAQLRRLGLAPAAAAASAVGQSLIAGTGVTITDNGDGTFTVNASGGGGSSEPREGSVTKPLVAGFNQVNFRVSTAVVDGATGIVMTDNGAVAATGFRLMEQIAAVPTPPWSLYGRFHYSPTSTSQHGLTIRNSASGKLVFIGRYQTGWLITNWTNVSTFSTNISGPTNAAVGQEVPHWWRIDNDGTNLIFYWSWDGRDFVQLLTVTLASFIGSVDRAGFGIQTDNTNNWLRCSSFGFTPPT